MRTGPAPIAKYNTTPEKLKRLSAVQNIPNRIFPRACGSVLAVIARILIMATMLVAAAGIIAPMITAVAAFALAASIENF
jgi:hypothetical protein